MDLNQWQEGNGLTTCQDDYPGELFASYRPKMDEGLDVTRCCEVFLWHQPLFGHVLISKFSNIRTCGFSVLEFRCLIFTLPTVSISCKLTVFLGTETVTFLPGVTVAIIPIPWNVFKPSIVLILWSILSATYSIWTSGLTFGISIPLTTDALRSSHWISLYELQNPCSWSESMRNLELKWWCNWTSRPNCSDATNTRGLTACIMASPIDDIFLVVSIPTKRLEKDPKWRGKVPQCFICWRELTAGGVCNHGSRILCHF